MRLSAYPAHPDYKTEWLPCHVFLDGELVSDCVYADDERGLVFVHARDRQGNLIILGDKVALRHMAGKVVFRRDWQHVNAIGFDTWMRDRIETAHREFMKRTSA